MLTNDKIKALSIFMHSRLSGKYTNKECIRGSVIEDEAHSQILKDEIKELVVDLESQGLTVDHLNNAIPSYYTEMIVHYYEVALDTMEKNITHGDVMVEGLIALSILSYILQEKEAGKLITEKKPSDLIEFFEKSGTDRKLCFKMIDVGTKIVDTVSAANYTNFLKSKRPKRKRKK